MPTDELWENKFAEAKALLEHSGELVLNPLQASPEQRSLTLWLWDQQKAYQASRLSPGQVAKLSALDALTTLSPHPPYSPRTLGVRQKQEQQWNAHLDQYLAYRAQHGGTVPTGAIAPDGFRIGVWWQGVRNFYLKGTLPPERQALLARRLGQTWFDIPTPEVKPAKPSSLFNRPTRPKLGTKTALSPMLPGRYVGAHGVVYETPKRFAASMRKAHVEILMQEVRDSLCTPTAWQLWLAQEAKRPPYSVNNLALLLYQRPLGFGAVLPASQWEKVGRLIKAGEVGLEINTAQTFQEVSPRYGRAPYQKTEFGKGRVFEHSQTQPAAQTDDFTEWSSPSFGASGKVIFTKLANCAVALGLRPTVLKGRDVNPAGELDRSRRLLILPPGATTKEAIPIMIRQIGRAVMHTDGDEKDGLVASQIETDSVVYAVSLALGRTPPPLNFAGVERWRGTSAVSSAALTHRGNRIRLALTTILDGMEGLPVQELPTPPKSREL